MSRSLAQIDHFVVLMMENRSFDHMLGFTRSADYAVGGLTGSEFNPENPANPDVKVPVSNTAAYLDDLAVDPSHAVTDVNFQLFDNLSGPPPTSGSNMGFVFNYGQQAGNTAQGSHNIMKCFAPAKLPVISTLAKEFAVCDRWFSSVPGPTWPNRFFVHCATSGGFVDNKFRNYPMRTIYENLLEAGVSWRVYFHDIPHTLALANLRDDLFKNRFRFFDEFLEHAGKGDLPFYSFIEPRYNTFLFKRANDQHPNHDVALGEHLIADVYEALRNSPKWQQTLLVVVWDEHGGIYDHELPPEAINPDGKIYQDPALTFAFDRLGVRVPAVLISPFILPGTIVHEVFDHASIPGLLKKRFNLPRFLTRRDEAANTFEEVLLLDSPRTDCPTELTRPGKQDLAARARAAITPLTVAGADIAAAASREPVSEFQESLMELANNLNGPETPFEKALRLAKIFEHEAAMHTREATVRFLGHR